MEEQACSVPPKWSRYASVTRCWYGRDLEVILSKSHTRPSHCVNCEQSEEHRFPRSGGVVASSFSSCHSTPGSASSCSLSKHLSCSTWGRMHEEPVPLLRAIGSANHRKTLYLDLFFILVETLSRFLFQGQYCMC